MLIYVKYESTIIPFGGLVIYGKSTQKASTAPLSVGRTAYKSSSEKTGENTGKSSYEEDTNHIISAVLDEVFQ